MEENLTQRKITKIMSKETAVENLNSMLEKIGGVVEVKTVVENKNNSDVYTYANLIQPHNLQLKPL